MKAITIIEPWASLIADGKKHIETRPWGTTYRGPIAIHAGLKKLNEYPPEVVKHAPEVLDMEYYYGHLIAIGELGDSIKMTEDWIASVPEPEYSFGWYAVGRTGLIIANVRRIEPVLVKGRLGLWEWTEAEGIEF